MSDPTSDSSWDHVKSVFGRAVELHREKRRAYLDEVTDGDPELRREVQSLLDGYDRGEGWMNSPTLDGRGSPPASEMPERIGRYEIRELLGTGGMGRVFRAHDPVLGRDVALKVLPRSLAGHPDRRARFLVESRAAARLSHPHIAMLHEIGEADGNDYIAMEYVPGRSLADVLREGPLELSELLAVALALAEALALAHEKGVIHRDVKAANVMLSDRGTVKLVDFGLAKWAEPPSVAPADTDTETDTETARRPPLTARGEILGTPGAMSPEQALGRPVDHRSDVFSLGSLLYEMVSGRPAFEAETVLETMEAVAHADPPSLTENPSRCPPALWAIIQKSLSKEPEDRYQGAADLAADLRGLSGVTGTVAPLRGPSPPRAGGTATRAAWRRRALALLAVAAGLLVIVLRPWDSWDSSDSWDAGPRADALLAIMCFENRADPEDGDELGAMLALLVTAELSAGGDLQLLSQQRMYDVARQAGHEDGRITRANASEIARLAGVDTMVLGQVDRLGEGLFATAELVDTGSGRALGSLSARGRDAGDLFAMAETLGRLLRVEMQAPDLAPEERLALSQQITTSVDAYRAYARGQKLLQRNRVEAAIEAFGEATEEDPSFALAHYHQAMALVWTGRATRPAFERAVAFADRLPEDLREFLEETRPYLFNDRMSVALPFLEQVVERDPHHRSALYHLGEVYTHSALWSDAGKAADTYRHLLEIDPGFSLVYEHLLSALLRQGDHSGARRWVDRWREDDIEELPERAGQLALWEGRHTEARAALGDRIDILLLEDEVPSPALRAALAPSVAAFLEELAEQSGVYRVLSLRARADALVSVGRFDDALHLLRLAVDVEGPVSPDGFVTNARNAARHCLAELLALRGDAAAARAEIDAALAWQPDSPRCLYLGVRHARLRGDIPTVLELERRLQELVVEYGTPTVTLHRDAAAAELALALGESATARERFRQLVQGARLLEDWYVAENSIGPLLRAGLAEACLATGDEAAAAAALDGLISSGIERLGQPVAWTSALHDRALIDMDAGREDEGRRGLERYLAWWGDVDHPDVDAARALLGP